MDDAMKKLIFSFLLLLAVPLMGQVSKRYLLFIIQDDINPAHQRQFEQKVNKVLKNVTTNDYTFTNVAYSNMVNTGYFITAMGIAEIAPDATDADLENIRQQVLPPDRDKIAIIPTDNPRLELDSRGLIPKDKAK